MYSDLTIFRDKHTKQINQQFPSKKTDELQKMQGLLNSERIKLVFGHYDVEVILQEDNVRISNLHSNGIMRTWALVDYHLPVPSWLQETHRKIYKGASIGQTIKDDGFNLSKENMYFGLRELPEFAKVKMQTAENNAAVYMYQLVVKNPKTFNPEVYCTISEVYSPVFLTLGDLNELYPKDVQKCSVITEAVQKHLDQINKTISSSLHKPF